MATTTVTPLAVGDKLRFHDEGTADKRWWWEVRAADDRYTIVTHPAAFAPKGTQMAYAIVDHHAGVRGPCNLLGGGYDFLPDPDDASRRLLKELNAGILELSHRRSVPLGTIELRP